MFRDNSAFFAILSMYLLTWELTEYGTCLEFFATFEPTTLDGIFHENLFSFQATGMVRF